MLEPFRLPFVQHAALEVLALAVGGGVIGTWIVLRGLAFFSHAVGTAAFPGLVLADGLSFSAHLGAAGTALLVSVGLGLLTRRRRSGHDSATALLLVGALVIGVVLASDVFHSGSEVESLLFGSLLAIGPGDIAWAVAAAAAVLVGTTLLGRRWLVVGFDPVGARELGARSPVPDGMLLAIVALVAVSALSATGALLATAMLVVPAATTRLVCDRVPTWQATTVALAAAEGLVGLWMAFELNAPPGPAIAVLGGAVFACVAVARAAAVRIRPQGAPA